MIYKYKQLYLTVNDFGYRYLRNEYYFAGDNIRLENNTINYVYIAISNNTLTVSNTSFPDAAIKIGIFHTANNEVIDVQDRFIQATIDGQTGTIGALADISYDNSNSNLVSTNGQDAVDEIQNANPGVQFDLTNTTSPSEGVLNWNSTDHTLQFGVGGGVALQIGQEQLLRGKPLDDDILNGQVVYIYGSAGDNPTIKLANSNNYNNATVTIALATEDVNKNSVGFFTTFGLVRDVNTDAFSEGDMIFLDNVDGGITNIMPEAPNIVVQIGYVIRKHANEGIIFVNIDVKNFDMYTSITQEPTGFSNPNDVIVTYDNVARTITLTGTVEAYYRNQPVSVLTSGWTSEPHPATLDALYFLVYNGTDFQWLQIGVDTLDFTYLLIAYIYYGTASKFALRECHGFMQWQTHSELHYTIGTYKSAGGTLEDYVLSSNTASERRPTVSECVLYDEDLPSTLPALSAGSYTQYYLTGAGAAGAFVLSASDIVPLSGSRPYYNQYTGGAWQQTLIDNNNYMAIWLIAVPTTADINSQAYRFVWVQGQSTSLVLSNIRNLTPADVNLGTLSVALTEFVFVAKVVIRYTGGDWVLTEVSTLTGNKFNQIASPAGNYLTGVAVGANLTGNGTISNPIDINPEVYNTTTAESANVYIDSAGDLFRSTSSLKYKTDIKDLKSNKSELIYKIRPVTYREKDRGKNIHFGLIAEELVDILPETVSFSNNKEPEGVKYDKFIPLLLKEIKTLKERIDMFEKLFTSEKGNIKVTKSLFGKTKIEYTEDK